MDTDPNAAAPELLAGVKILSGERRGFVLYPLGRSTLIGRERTVSVFLPDVKASRKHCLIHWHGKGYVLVDVSSNGTWLNEQRVDKRTELPLNSGDRIRVGATILEFRTVPRAAPQRPQPQATPPLRRPVQAGAVAPPGAPPVEFVFDFSEGDPVGSDLDKVFFDRSEEMMQTRKWNNATERMPSIPPSRDDDPLGPDEIQL